MHQILKNPSQSPHTNQETLTLKKWNRQLLTPIGSAVSPNWAVLMWSRFEPSWITPPRSCTTTSLTRCSASWQSGKTLHHGGQWNRIHQSQRLHSDQHRQGLCPSPVARSQFSKENTRFLRRTRMFADHRGTNGPPQEGHLQRRTVRYLHQLPQNQLGISCHNSGGKLRPASKLGKKRSWHPNPIPLLRVLRILLWDCRHRWITGVGHSSLHF